MHMGNPGKASGPRPLTLDARTHDEFVRLASRRGASWKALGRLAGVDWSTARRYAARHGIVVGAESLAPPEAWAGMQERCEEGDAPLPPMHRISWLAITAGTVLDGAEIENLP